MLSLVRPIPSPPNRIFTAPKFTVSPGACARTLDGLTAARVLAGAAMPDILVDESALPMVVVTYPETVSAEQLRTLFARFDLLSRRHGRVAYLVDMTLLDPVRSAAGMLKSVGDLFAAHRPALARVTLCEARVIPNGLLRSGLAAFDRLAPDKWPCANFATRREAEAWVRGHLARQDAGARAK
jgi:hypothetical protein